MGIKWQSGFHTGGKREPTRRETDVGNGGFHLRRRRDRFDGNRNRRLQGVEIPIQGTDVCRPDEVLSDGAPATPSRHHAGNVRVNARLKFALL